MPREYTFGVELELIVCGLAGGDQDPDPTDSRQVHFPLQSIEGYVDIINNDSKLGAWDFDFAHTGACAQAIASALLLEGIPAFPWFRTKDGPGKASEWELSGWEVTTDESCMVREDEDTPFFRFGGGMGEVNPYMHHCIEVVSPVLTRGNSGDRMMDDEQFEEVGRVAEIIQREFRVFTNRTTGLHVHVGNGYPLGQAFPLSTIQKLMAFLWAFEPGIEKLHPPIRRDHIRNHYCHPLRKELHRDYQGKSGRTIVDAILSCTSIRQLGVLLARWQPGEHGRTERFGAYNIQNLARNFTYNQKKTVEFRQHAGSLDADEIKTWAKFCVQLVAYVARSSVQGIRDDCYREVDNQRTRRFMYIDEICTGIEFDEGANQWAYVKEGEQDDGDPEVDGGFTFMPEALGNEDDEEEDDDWD